MKNNIISKISLLIVIAMLALTSSIAKEIGFASDRVKLIKVIDGDSFIARIEIWPKTEITATIRLAGIDTPELRGKCTKETELAQKAKTFTREWLTTAPLSLTNIKQGKYANRYIATVNRFNDTQDLSDALLINKLAQPYPSPKSWCE